MSLKPHYTHFHLVDHMDIRALLGILYLRAALRVNLMSTSTIWHHRSSNNLFSATMSHSCFKFISCFITFDDKASRTECWKTDKFACMRELFELMNVGNVKCRYPSPMLSINETLYPYYGAIGLSSAIQISQQNMAYYSGVSVIQQPHIHITP